MKWLTFLVVFTSIILFPACKTKSELRREQEVEKLRQEVTQVRGNRADVEVLSEELRVEMSRLGAVVEEQGQQSRRQYEELKQQVEALTTRMQAVEQRAVSDEPKAAAPAPAGPSGYEAGKKLFEEGRYDEASEVLRTATKSRKADDARKALFLLGESLFAAKDYASAALEFSEYRKKYAKDSLVPNAIYRQANAFRSMGKPKEAKLFYQELVEKFPKNALAAKAKAELKKLK